MDVQASEQVYPRVTIEYCTKCKWMLRAAYYAQELLSTFESALSEVSLRPAESGTFRVSITALPVPKPSSPSSAPAPPTTTTTTTAGPALTTLLWDRRTDGGFPETKELKRRVRDVIEPGRNLGHVDRGATGPRTAVPSDQEVVSRPGPGPAPVSAGPGGHPGTCEVPCKECE